MSKSYYRDLLRDLKPYIKLAAFARQIGMNPSTLSLFMRSPDNDYMISLGRLQELERAIMDFMSNFA